MPAVAGKSAECRPWRTGSTWSQVCSKEETALRARPWSNVGSRLASAFAQCSEDESEAAWPADGASDFGAEPDEVEQLWPAPRGERTCLCAGEVLFMCGHYGWLTTESVIEHPSAGKNGGRIYINKRDIASGVSLVEGDKVVFYLYVDSQGLGAEECRLQAWEEDVCTEVKQNMPGMNPDAAVFVPGMPQAVAQVAPVSPWACPPPAVSRMPVAQAFNAFALNEAYWSDLESDDSSSEDEQQGIKAEGDDDGDVESNGESSDSETFGIARWQGDLGSIPRRGSVRRLRRRKAKTHSSGSSSTSVPSDSDCAMPLPPPQAPPPGLQHPSFRPPPGLSLA